MMENVDMFNAATAPLTFHDFLDRMRQPAASDLVKSIKSFIIGFQASPPDPDKDSQSVQDFYSNMEGAFKTHSLWSGATKEELESAGEGLEKYLMTKLFSRAFAPLPEDAERDQILFTKMNLLQQFLHPEHLDIAPCFQNESSWLLAQKELQKMNTYKAPRDKLVCILNCCRVINNLLLNATMAKNDNPPGADDFLPVLIYVVIKANPPQLQSNLLYIQRFRHQSRLVAEAAYFFTNLVSAASFIENLDAKSLSMDERDFEEKMQLAKAFVDGVDGGGGTSARGKVEVGGKPAVDMDYKSSNRGDGSYPVVKPEHTFIPQADHPFPHSKAGRLKASDNDHATVPSHSDKVPSLANSEAGASTALLPGFSRQLARKFPYLYARAGDLTIADVESLLNDYKGIVVKYVALHKNVEGSGPWKVEALSECESKPTVVLEVTHTNLSNPKAHGELAVKSINEIESSHPDGPSDIYHGLQVMPIESSHPVGPSDIYHGLQVMPGTTGGNEMTQDFRRSGDSEVSCGSLPSDADLGPVEKVRDLEVLEDVKRELEEAFLSDLQAPESQGSMDEFFHSNEQSQRTDIEFEDKLPQEAG